MANLDWRSAAVTPASQRSGNVIEVSLAAPPPQWAELLQALSAMKEGGEVKLSLPVLRAEPFPVEEEWTLYFKRSTGSDRSMAAHPQEREWVGSLLLSEKRLQWLLGKLQEREPFGLWDGGGFSYPSNLKVAFTVK